MFHSAHNLVVYTLFSSLLLSSALYLVALSFKMCPTPKNVNSVPAGGPPGLVPRECLGGVTNSNGESGAAQNAVTDAVTGGHNARMKTYTFSKSAARLWQEDGGKWLTNKLTAILYIEPQDLIVAQLIGKSGTTVTYDPVCLYC